MPRTTLVRPTGQERTFGTEDLIVSKTDLKGHITYANDVFVAVSQIERADLLTKPHNVIRHPEMPRGVFRLLWETLAAGREIFAYVNNLAADGANYWVLAHVTPTVDPGGRIIGYHSNRRSPSRRAVLAVKPVYDVLLAEERRHSSSVAAAAASHDVLNDELERRNQTYEQFVWSLIKGAP